MTGVRVRSFVPDDASAVDDLLAEAFGGFEDDLPGLAESLALGSLRLSQTGSRLIVAEDEEGIAGAIRWREADGVAWADLLVAAVAGAGRALVRGVEQAAQDRGLRLVRGAVPEGDAVGDYLGRMGYLPVSFVPGPRAHYILEKRLPLLTVREQRRADAAVIAELTGADPWPFESGQRPGWFVLADGDRVTGVVSVRGDGGRMKAVIAPPALVEPYRRRGLEAWMLDRAALYAATAGFVTAEVAATPDLDRLERDLEDRQWRKAGSGRDARYVRDLGTIPLEL